jgi:hypothetical protein
MMPNRLKPLAIALLLAFVFLFLSSDKVLDILQVALIR